MHSALRETGLGRLVLGMVCISSAAAAADSRPAAPDRVVASNVSEKAIVMDSFKVSTEVLENSEIGLLTARKKAAAISDSIGSGQFERLAASNAAEAMAKVTGASLVDGKYVLIRGLGDRYANTLLNGAVVPTADPEKRAVQMDQFPADLLESIVTTKSFTPDQPGSFSGGSVNLRTKSFPEHFFFTSSVTAGFNDRTTGESLLHIPGSSKDGFAMGAVDREAPEVPVSMPDRAAAQIAARAGNFSLAEQLDSASKAFDNRNYFPTSKRAGPDGSVSVAWGDRMLVGRGEGIFGYTASFTYDKSSNLSAGGERNRFEGIVSAPQVKLALTPDPTGFTFDTSERPPGTPALGVTSSAENVSWGAMAKLAYRPTQAHEFSVDLYHHQSGENLVQRGLGEQQRDYPGSYYEVYDLLYTERKVTSLQFAGRSSFPVLGDLLVEYRTAISNSTQDQPDYRTLAAYYDPSGGSVNATGVQPNRFFRKLEENSVEAGIDATRPFEVFSREAKLKLGASILDGDREYQEQRFQWSNRPQSRNDLNAFPGPIGIIGRTANSVTLGNTLARLQEPNNYSASQTFSSAYGMVDIPLVDGVRAIFGTRIERTDMSTTPLRVAGLNPRDGVLKETDALSALNLVYARSPKVNWRAAYGRTLARPTFKEMTDIRYEDVFTLDTYLGNPELTRTLIDNFDLRWEYFPRRGETIAVSAFYKRMKDPIEVVFTPSTGATQPQNVERGTVYGVEFEVTRNLGFLSEYLRPFTAGANLALVSSEVSIPESEMASIRLQEPNACNRRELMGQSPYVINADLSYSRPSSGTAATLSFNIVGERLSLVQFGSLPDVYEQPAGNLNLVVSQRLTERLRLKIAARNILDTAREKLVGFEDRDLVYERFHSGRSVGVALSWMFE